MRKLLLYIGLIWTTLSYGQTGRDTLRAFADSGWEAYRKGNYAAAEKRYRTALQYGDSDTVQYNLAASLLRQNRKNEASEHFRQVTRTSSNDSLKADAWHNLGNIYYEKKKFDKAVEAYKNALRLRPGDDETRYNYALAKEKLKQQQKQNQNKNKQKQQQKNNKQNKDKQNNNRQKNQNKNQENKDKRQQKNQKNDKNQDQKNKNKQHRNNRQNENKDNKEQKNQDRKQNQPENQHDKSEQSPHKKNQKQPERPRRSKLSPEETKRLLQALKNKENQTLKKVKLRQAKRTKTKKSEKDW